MSTRKEQAALAKGRLIQAAKDLIERKGYENVNIADITNACDMSTGNFYNYFKSKDDLIVVIERDPYAETSAEHYIGMSCGVLEKLQHFMDDYLRFSSESYNVSFDRQWFIYHANHPTAPDDPKNKGNMLIFSIEQILRSSVEKGELRRETPIATIAESVSFTIMGSTYQHVLTAGAYDRKTFYSAFCNTILPSVLSPWYSEK